MLSTDAAANVAAEKYRAGDSSGIADLERALKDAKVDLPPRSERRSLLDRAPGRDDHRAMTRTLRRPVDRRRPRTPVQVVASLWRRRRGDR